MASEVLSVALKSALSNAEADLLTVASGHTYTVLSELICETAAAAEVFNLLIDDGGG